MKTKNTLSLIAVAMIGLTSLTAGAEVLTPDEALSRVLSTSGNLTPKSFTLSQEPKLVYTQSTDGIASVYLFANQNDKSYMVVSADDATPALLGYGEDLSQMNPTLTWWLGEYGRQIDWARKKGISSTINTKATMAETDFPEILPMTTTRWNQNAPFNNDCPEINGERAVTGCVATALAQVMKYHNWPNTGTGSNTYTPSSMSSSLTVDFGNTTYNWDEMINSYDGTATTAQKNAVATLMYSCGVAVNMDYTSSESSATSFAAAQAMVNYFKYDKGIMFYSRDYYTISDWNTLVYNQLKDYGPVQYSGQSNDGGHSFVCDGYSSDGYFHINWGWGGMSDGYFLLTALNPTSQGIGGSTSGYNFDQDIIGNVKPENGSNSSIVPNFAAQAFEANATNVNLGNSVTFSGPMYSFSLASISGTLGIKLVDQSGTTSYLSGTPFSNMSPEYGVNSFSVTLPSDLSEGTYTISPAVKSTEGTWYDMPVAVGATTTKTMSVSNGTASFTTTSAANITVSDIDLKTDFYVGSQFEITLTVTNNSDQEYLGGLGLVLVNSEDEEVGEGSEYPLDLQPGETVDISYLSGFTAISSSEGNYAETSGITAGTYYIAFVDESGNQLSQLQSITINAEATPTLRLSDFTIEGGTEVQDMSNIVFTGNLSVSEGYFGNTLTLVIFPYSTTGGSIESVATYSTNPIFLSAGQSTDLNVTADFSNGTPGKTYFAMLYNGSSAAVDNQLVFTLSDTSGTIDQVGDITTVVSTEIYNINGVRVNSENPAPGLYIVKKIMSDGSIQTSKALF